MITIPTPPPSGTFNAFPPRVAPKNSSLPRVVIIGAIILVLGFGYYFYSYGGFGFRLFQAPVLAVSPSLSAVDIKVSQSPRLQFDLFDSSFYKSLKSYGNLPITADSLGRVNPFIPY